MKTSDSVLEELSALLGAGYTFERFQYTRSFNKVCVTCVVHGDFFSLVGNLRKGSRCPKCASEVRSIKATWDTSLFIQKARERHGDRCDYSRTQYKRFAEKVTIICRTHGEFETTPATHLSSRDGVGCMKCRGELSSSTLNSGLKHFIERSKKAHGDRYDYSAVKYDTVSEPVSIICQEHGIFQQRPDHHYAGSGCAACQSFGFRNGIEGYLYIMKSSDFVKIGICNRKPEARKRSIERTSGKTLEITSYWWFADGDDAKTLEKQLLKYLRSNFKPVEDNFDGSTECFTGVDEEHLKLEIIKRIGRN